MRFLVKEQLSFHFCGFPLVLLLQVTNKEFLEVLSKNVKLQENGMFEPFCSGALCGCGAVENLFFWRPMEDVCQSKLIGKITASWKKWFRTKTQFHSVLGCKFCEFSAAEISDQHSVFVSELEKKKNLSFDGRF